MMTVLMILLVRALCSLLVVDVRAKRCWRLFLSTKPLQPTWMVDRVACIPRVRACSTRCRYLLSFLTLALEKFASQQTVSSKRWKCPGQWTTRSGLRSVGRSSGSEYGCPGRSAMTLLPGGRCCWRCRKGFPEPGHAGCCISHVVQQLGSGSVRGPGFACTVSQSSHRLCTGRMTIFSNDRG